MTQRNPVTKCWNIWPLPDQSEVCLPYKTHFSVLWGKKVVKAKKNR